MDAFSTVASAYTLAKELYNYYNDWKDCPNDVAELRDELLWLSKVLQIVEKILNNPALDPDTVECAREARVRCSSATQELKEKLTSIRKEGISPSKAADIRAKLQRSLYPFKKSTIKRLAGAVAECLEQLDTVIQLLSLDNSLRLADLLKAQGDELRALLGTVQKTIRDQAVADQKSYAALHAQGDAIQHGVSSMKASVIQAAAQEMEHRRNKEVTKWLSPPTAKPVDIDEQESGTNSWFLESPAYQSWQTGQSSALFIHGGMGCGKSVLLAAIEKDLRQAHQSAIVMAYYFSGESQDNANLNGWLRFLVSRLSPPHRMHPRVLALWKVQEHTSERPKTKDLVAGALQILRELRTPCFIIVDALDEIPKGPLCAEVLSFLQEVSDTKLSSCRVLCTGRPHPKIISNLGRSDRFQMLEIPADANRLDVEQYVKNQIERIPDLQAQSDAIKGRILSRLVGGGPAMFRLAVLQMRDLESLQPLIEDSIIDTLDNLPRTLEETYTRILKSINQQKLPSMIECAQAALNWLTFTYSVLSVDQLIDVMAVTARRGWDWENAGRQFRADDLLELLPDLVTISGHTAQDNGGAQDGPNVGLRITFSHFSVREYLLSEVAQRPGIFALNPRSGNQSIADTCLTYLYTTNSQEKSDENYPLRSYAFDNWREHILDVIHQQYKDLSPESRSCYREYDMHFDNLAFAALILTFDTMYEHRGTIGGDDTSKTHKVTARRHDALVIPFFEPHLRDHEDSQTSERAGHGAMTPAVQHVYANQGWVLTKPRHGPHDGGTDPDWIFCYPQTNRVLDRAWCEAHWDYGPSDYFVIVCRDGVDYEFDIHRIIVSISGSQKLSTAFLPKVLLPWRVTCSHTPSRLSRKWDSLSRDGRDGWSMMRGGCTFTLGPGTNNSTLDQHLFRNIEAQPQVLKLVYGAWERTDQRAPQASSRLRVDCKQCMHNYACSDCIDCTACSGCRTCKNCKNCGSSRDCGHCTDCDTCRDCTNCTSCISCTDLADCTACSVCRDCTNCVDCVSCRDCTGCTKCTKCSRCRTCKKCTNCEGCVACLDLRDCNRCRDSTNCTDCVDCRDCTNCKGCRNCTDCKNCVDCRDCVGCDGLTGVTGWWRNQDPSCMQLVLYTPVRHFD
jgi:hypothetical protein